MDGHSRAQSRGASTAAQLRLCIALFLLGGEEGFQWPGQVGAPG